MTTEHDYRAEVEIALSQANAHPEVAAAIIQAKAIDRFMRGLTAAIDRQTTALLGKQIEREAATMSNVK